MITIGQCVPNFICDAAIETNIKKISLADYADTYKLLFFYPLNFTFVCPTELHALQDSIVEFQKRSTNIFAVSVDSVYSHLAWLSLSKQQGGIQGITFPLLSDLTHTLSQAFGVFNADAGVALRGVFLLNKENIVHYMSIQNLSLGRNVEELIRVVDALQYVEKNGGVCPANWVPGSKAMKPTKMGIKEYFD